jgi:hypothetical protein
VLAAMAAGAGAYIYICVMAGTLTGAFGLLPMEHEEMNEYAIMDILGQARAVLNNTFWYLVYPRLLWQDISAWNAGGWLTLAAAGMLVQVSVPQIFIKRGYSHGT